MPSRPEPLRACLLAVLVCALASVPAWAQGTRFEAGIEVAASKVGPYETRGGIGGWFDVNLTSALAAETHVTFFPRSGEGGPFRIASGARATLLRTPRVAFYGVALPGLYRARDVSLLLQDKGSEVQRSSRSTQFALQLGAGFMIAPNGRLPLRVEVNRLIYALGAVRNSVTRERIGNHQLGNGWDLNIGVVRRGGASLRLATEMPTVGRWTVGAQAGATLATGPVVAGAVGMFASYRASRFCDLDASISTFIHDRIWAPDREGGGILQAVGGVKLGVRTGRFGVFFKARTGVHSYSQALNFRGDWAAGEFFVRENVIGLDIGGVVETYPSPRVVVRFDLGESLSLFPRIHQRKASTDRETGYTGYFYIDEPRQQFYTVPLRAGIGWRF